MSPSEYNQPSKPFSNRFLKQVLTVDSAVSLAAGALQVTASAALHGLTGIPAPVYLATGLFLLVFGVLVGVLAWLKHPPSTLVWVLIVGNVGWALASSALVFQPIANYTPLGNGYLVFNALWVLLMASMEFAGLRRRERAVAYSI